MTEEKKTKNGNIINEKRKSRADEQSTLFEDHRKDYNVMKHNFNFAAPVLMKNEIQAAIGEMKKGKAAGPDSESVELKEAFEDCDGIDKITTLLYKIHEVDQIPSDISNLNLLHCQRNEGLESVNYISFISYITEILLRIIIPQYRNKIKPEIAAEECGFVKRKGTANAVYIFRDIIE